MTRFVLGAIVGAVVVWVWGEEIRRFTNTKGRSARLVAADTLQSVQSVAEEMFDSERLDFVDIVTRVDTHLALVRLAASP